MPPITKDKVPQALVESILAGRCIAFVGAGFSQPAVPAWSALLGQLSQRLGVTATLPDNATALEYELLGQMLREKARSDAAFEAEVQAVLQAFDDSPPSEKGKAIVKQRCEWLRSIPFRAILTTNFDPWLPGTQTNAATYWKVLRQERGRWWEFPVRSTDPHPDVPIIKLHGDANGDPNVAGLVLGRADYRRRVYGEQAYTSFIRAAFASYTVLFLGVSFTDAYLNELRSETLQLLGGGHEQVPWGYAVMQLDAQRQPFAPLYRSHEGIEVLPIDTFDQFDEWLGSIAARTAARERLRELLTGKRIVWIDRRPANNEIGKELFTNCGAEVDVLTSSDDLTSAHAKADLIITQFGWDLRGDSCAFRVLDRLRAETSRAPVLVFASPDGPVESNRRECLRRGAWEYATQWSELYRLIEMLMSSGR